MLQSKLTDAKAMTIGAAGFGTASGRQTTRPRSVQQPSTRNDRGMTAPVEEGTPETKAGSGLIYAGIGSRETPADMLARMCHLAAGLQKKGWQLRSGGADGADNAFATGAGCKDMTLYLPWSGYNEVSSDEVEVVVLNPVEQADAEALARKHHSAWTRCGRGARALHARNAAIIRGRRLDSPVAAVICWTPLGAETGGTATGIRIARAAGIPVLNLALVSAAEAEATLDRLATCDDQQHRRSSSGTSAASPSSSATTSG